VIAITFALPAESSNLVALLQEKKHSGANKVGVIHGRIDNHSIAVFHTGVGAKACADKIDKFLQAVRPEFLISSGFAGAVREDWNVGDLLLAENFSDRRLLMRAEQALSDRPSRVGRMFTSRSMIDSPAERNEIARDNGADAVDMETDVIAQACAMDGVPILSLRVISDTSRQPFPAPPNVLFDIERQQTNTAKFIAYFLRHPGRVIPLFGFAGRVSRARRVLTDAILTLLPQMGTKA
jgi:adenosylhomocysteine nucleosidase